MKTENKRNPVKIVKNGVLLVRKKAIPKISHFLQFKNTIKERKQTSIILVVSAFLVVNVFLLNTIGGQLLYSTSLQSHGIIETVGVAAYTDSACTIPVSNVDWGRVAPGYSITNTLYVRNEGNSDLTLSFNTNNWNPVNAQNYLTLSWNYAGQTVKPNQVVQITLTLSVSQSTSGIESFYFDIIISGAN
ncbi:MAG: hypothetical protein CW716_03325 [Candidatus Bathyarchaeum sp.]|nr:MAG: hypothetical protein CW716_03325 [Candidatus Bathyarchaeum sp.]